MDTAKGGPSTKLSEGEQLRLDVMTLQARIDNLTERIEGWTSDHARKQSAYRGAISGKLGAMEDHLYALDTKVRRLE